MYDWEWLEELRRRAAAIAEPIWETLLRDIVRRVRDAGAITSTAEYEIYRAEQLGLAEQAIKDAIAEQLQISNAAIDQLFEDLADETVLFEQNAELRQLVDAYSAVAKKAAAADFENLWAPGPDGKLYTVKEAYAKIMDFAFMQTVTGTYDYQRAVREATRELLRRGLRTIPGKDNRSYRIEYAVRQYVQNRMGELFNEISARNYDAIGADGWEISAHSAPAPDHAPYQGRQYSEEEYERINASLDRKFGWWNCAHLIYPIKLGVSPPAYTEEQRQRYLDENEAGVEYDGLHYTLYEAKQRKRQLESMISQQKYEILAAEGDPKLLREQQIRLQNMRREYTRFCKETNQTPENWRTMVEGFGRSEASKAAWAERKLGINFTDANTRDKMVRGSGVFSSSDNDRHVHRQIERQRPDDPSEIQEIVDKFCQSAVKMPFEQMLVVTPNGEVHYFTSGNASGIKGEAFQGAEDLMRGSYNIHTHPEKTTQFSFSWDVDMPCFFEDGSAVMEAADYKYRYRFERPKGITFDQWEQVRGDVRRTLRSELVRRGFDTEDLVEQEEHVLIEETCRRLGISDCYRRWRTDE